MNDPVLIDPKTPPTDAIIASALGKSYALWQNVFKQLHTERPALVPEWRYYNDGKSWLMKLTYKKKTVVWVGVYAGFFRFTAYLTEKARAAVEASDISDDCKDQFSHSKRFGKLIAVSVPFKKKADVRDGLALVALKLALK
jgi:hypothetical protein